MITRYTNPKDMISEFMEDRKKVIYWLNKMMSKEKADGPTRTRFRDVLHSYDKEKRSEVVYYHSPQTGNDWMAWYRMISNGYGQVPTMRDYEVCYQMTDQYMTIQLPTTIVYKDIEVKGISMFEIICKLCVHRISRLIITN